MSEWDLEELTEDDISTFVNNLGVKELRIVAAMVTTSMALDNVGSYILQILFDRMQEKLYDF